MYRLFTGVKNALRQSTIYTCVYYGSTVPHIHTKIIITAFTCSHFMAVSGRFSTITVSDPILKQST